QVVVVGVVTGVIRMTSDNENGVVPCRITFEIAHKAVDFALRRGRQTCRIKREVSTVLHIDDNLALQSQIRNGVKSLIRLGIRLSQTSLELPEFALDTAHSVS